MAGVRATTAAQEGDGPGLPTRQLGPYELLTVLGRGTSAVVLLARRPGIERLFALKLLGPDLDAEGAARVRREAQVASRLDHPGIVRVVDTGTWNGQQYLVMDHVPGPTLKERLAQVGRFASADAARVVLDLAEAVEHAHAAGVVHRDLKPANVIIDGRDGRPKVTDFGLARDLQAPTALTQDGAVLGTPYYMAPEQLRGGAVDARADVWALGVILYELVCGRRPFDGRDVGELGWRILAGAPPPPRTLVPDVDPRVEAVALGALSVDPAGRPASAGALAAALRAVVGEAPPPSASSVGWSGDRTIGATSSAPSGARPAPPAAGGRGAALAAAVLAGSTLLLGAAVWTHAARGRLRAAGAALDAATRALADADAAAARDRAARAALARDAGAEVERAEADRDRRRAAADRAVAEARAAVACAAAVDGPVADVVDRVIERLADVPGAATLRGDLLRNRGRYDEALAVARAALERGDPDPGLLVLAARAELALGRGEAVVAWLRKLEARPDLDETTRAFARAAGRDVPDAGAALRGLLEAAQRAPDWHPMRMLITRTMRDLVPTNPRLEDDALRAAGEAIRTDPSNPDAWVERATIALAAVVRAPDRAPELAPGVVLDLRRARALRPRADDWVDTGVALVLLDRPLWAAGELEAAPAQPGGDAGDTAARARLWLGHARAAAGEVEAAVEAWRAARPARVAVADAPLHARFFGRVPADARARALADAPALRAAVEAALGAEAR